MVFAEFTAEGVGIALLVGFLLFCAGLAKIGKAMWASDAGKGIIAGLFRRLF